MSQMSVIKSQFIANGEARVTLPNDKALSREERQKGRQRIRSLLVNSAFYLHKKVKLETTETEIIARVVGEI